MAEKKKQIKPTPTAIEAAEKRLKEKSQVLSKEELAAIDKEKAESQKKERADEKQFSAEMPKPCANCGTRDIKLQKLTVMKTIKGREIYNWRYKCKCGMMTIPFDTIWRALRCWNRRPK